LRAEYAKRLFLTEEQELQQALTSARIVAGNEILMGEAEAQKAIEVGSVVVVVAEEYEQWRQQ